MKTDPIFFYIVIVGHNTSNDENLLHTRPEVQQKGLRGGTENGTRYSK